MSIGRTCQERKKELQPLTVLIVDDNDAFRKGLVQYLGIQDGVEIKGQAKDGLEAMQMAATLDPDLILMDISMPNMDGLEATKKIKENGSRSKIVLVTIHDEGPYRQLAEQIGADGFISKGSVKRDIPKILKKVRGEFIPPPTLR